MSSAEAQDFAAQRSRMVAEVEAMYAETRRETGLPAMSPAEAAERYRDTACFLVAVYNSGAPQRQLREQRSQQDDKP